MGQQRNSNAYTYIIGIQHSTEKSENVVRYNRKSETQHGGRQTGNK